jgi:hypothetical protein
MNDLVRPGGAGLAQEWAGYLALRSSEYCDADVLAPLVPFERVVRCRKKKNSRRSDKLGQIMIWQEECLSSVCEGRSLFTVYCAKLTSIQDVD